MGSDGRWYPPAPPRPPSVNPMAIVSLVLGIVGVTGCWCLAGIPAIVVGYRAKREIEESDGRQQGEGFATAGIVLGWLTTAVSLLGLLAFIALVWVGATVGSDHDVGPPTTVSVPR